MIKTKQGDQLRDIVVEAGKEVLLLSLLGAVSIE